MTIYAATTNPGKLREFADCASNQGITVLPLPGLKEMPEPVEDALTFMGNAELKAVAYSRLAHGLTVLADDSGLEVSGLGAQPGVRSARFADDLGFSPGMGTKDERNNRCLLSTLHAQEKSSASKDRRAKFVCALALALNGEVLLRAEGFAEGEIIDEERGTTGFGYDPLFLISALGRTTAELNPEEKWAISHRGNAFRSLLAQFDSGGRGAFPPSGTDV